MRAFIAFAIAFFAFPAWAEISDKTASQAQLWLQGGVVGVIALWLAIRTPLLGLLFGALGTCFLGYGAFATHADPYIGRSLSAEQGLMYWVASYGSATLGLFGACFGAFARRRRRQGTGGRRDAM